MKKLFVYHAIHAMVFICMVTSCNQKPVDLLPVKVKINDTIFNNSISGKLIFLFSRDTAQQLVYGVNPEDPHPVFTYNIENWNPSDTIVIDHFTDEWYEKFSALDGEYACRVILDENTEERSSFVAQGNGYSKRVKRFIDPSGIDPILFEIDNKFDGWIFTESESVKEIKFKSSLLSDFWDRDIFIQSAVVVPQGYNKENADHNLVFVFPGFGSSHATITYGTGQIDRYGMNTMGKPKIFVFMDSEFFQGYHHFANSENNGPWGKAFIEEFIPYIDKHFGINPDKSKRYLMGQSSGAWTALWLQTEYPGYFEGAFAASPDPIDFRAHGYNIYLENSNYYFPKNADSASKNAGISIKLLAQLEDVLGEYGQIRSWEATFSPKNEKGEPALLFERETGAINPNVAQHWGRYDISRIIRDDPEKYRLTIGEKLHIFVSRDDPYELYKSIELFENMLKENNITADIQYYDDLGHNVWTDSLRAYIHNLIDSVK